jgi:hypothetical protein
LNGITKQYCFDSLNEDNLPKIDQLVTESLGETVIEQQVDAQVHLDANSGQYQLDKTEKSVSLEFVDSSLLNHMYQLNNIFSPQYFRLFLIEMGFLDAQQKDKLKSLEISDELLKGLKLLDKLPEYLVSLNTDELFFLLAFCTVGLDSRHSMTYSIMTLDLLNLSNFCGLWAGR